MENLIAIRGLIPGLRLWRNRLRQKLEHTEPGTAYHRLLEEEFDECVALLKGLLSLAGRPRYL